MKKDVVDFAARRAPTRIEYSLNNALPKLAWVARLDTAQGRLQVQHGRTVECRPTWLVEGVWDGPFADGEFHRGAHLFGSGVRLDEDAVYFVPSAALVDRLVYCWDGPVLCVSNSVVALLAATGARMDFNHDYLVEAKAILDGIDRYDPAFQVLHPSIKRFHQVYHKVMMVRDGALTLERMIPVRNFASFDEYVSMLRERLAAICENGRDGARRTPLASFGTLSSGYDSSVVSSLVRHLGVTQFFTYMGSWGPDSEGRPEYDTAPIAAALGIEPIRIETPRVPSPEDELLLRAACPLGQQVPLIAMAQHVERAADGAMVFTGFHGGVVWDMNVPDDAVSEGIIRHDTSGIDLTELRLKSGFFNVAVPFFYAASIESIVAISRSDEMTPWKVGTSYDRPIARRIVEGAGVPRERFGFLKGGMFGPNSRPVNPDLRRQYMEYLGREILPLPLVYARGGCDRIATRLLSRADGFAKRRLHSQRLQQALATAHRWFREGYSVFGRRNYRDTLYVWSTMQAVHRLRERGLGVSGDAAVAVRPSAAAVN